MGELGNKFGWVWLGYIDGVLFFLITINSLIMLISACSRAVHHNVSLFFVYNVHEFI